MTWRKCPEEGCGIAREGDALAIHLRRRHEWTHEEAERMAAKAEVVDPPSDPVAEIQTPNPVAAPASAPAPAVTTDEEAKPMHPCADPNCKETFPTAQGAKAHYTRKHKLGTTATRPAPEKPKAKKAATKKQAAKRAPATKHAAVESAPKVEGGGLGEITLSLEQLLELRTGDASVLVNGRRVVIAFDI